VFLIIKLSSDDINDSNFDLFGRLLKFIFTFLILSIIWVLLFSKTGHWRRKWVSFSTLVLHNLQIISFVFTPIYLPFSICRLWAIIPNLVSTLLYKTDTVLIASIARCDSKQQHVCKEMNQYMINTNRIWILSFGIELEWSTRNSLLIWIKNNYPV
jgi:hypothetical protein